MRWFVFLCPIFLIGNSIAEAQEPRQPITRAKRPVFKARDKSSFFENVFSDGLVGKRPRDFGVKKTSDREITGTEKNEPKKTEEFLWSALISGESIQDEVKQIRISLDRTITSPSSFRSGGSRTARVDYSMLAMLFAVIHDYDGEVKWKKDASAARDAFAKCASNAKSNTEQGFRQAKTRKNDLADLLNGANVEFQPSDEPANRWADICDRNPLMGRLKSANNGPLKRFTAKKTDFESNLDRLKREAQIVALIGEVLALEGLDDSEDDDYRKLSRAMQTDALSLIKAIDARDFTQAESAVTAINQSCNRCHENWK